LFFEEEEIITKNIQSQQLLKEIPKQIIKFPKKHKRTQTNHKTIIPKTINSHKQQQIEHKPQPQPRAQSRQKNNP
jgi:hypothetical protein